ncbi:MAG: hypothetical protein WCW87_01560 [Candidatus Paceibacterota bacterium]
MKTIMQFFVNIVSLIFGPVKEMVVEKIEQINSALMKKRIIEIAEKNLDEASTLYQDFIQSNHLKYSIEHFLLDKVFDEIPKLQSVIQMWPHDEPHDHYVTVGLALDAFYIGYSPFRILTQVAQYFEISLEEAYQFKLIYLKSAECDPLHADIMVYQGDGFTENSIL